MPSRQKRSNPDHELELEKIRRRRVVLRDKRRRLKGQLMQHRRKRHALVNQFAALVEDTMSVLED